MPEEIESPPEEAKQPQIEPDSTNAYQRQVYLIDRDYQMGEVNATLGLFVFLLVL